MPCSCYPKAKAILSHVHEQNNCPSFGTKSTLSCIPTEQTWLVMIYTVSIKHALGTVDFGMQTADCGLQTTDYSLGLKHRLMYKTRTKHYGLGIKRAWTQV